MQLQRHPPILVALDAAGVSNTALSYAAILARQLDAELYCVHAVEPVGRGEVPDVENVRKLAREHGVEPTILVEEGLAPQVILQSASEWAARYIVIGTHGRSGLSRAVMGSVAEHVLRESTVPVITISPKLRGVGRLKRIAVALDGSAPAHRALLNACELARACKGAIELCYVIGSEALVPAVHADANNEGRMLLDVAALTAAEFGLTAGKHIVEGDFAPRLVDFATGMDAQLIALGTHGRTGIERALLGSLAESVVRISPLPVLVVK